MSSKRDESGQAIPFVLLLFFCVLVAMVTIVWLGMQASSRAHAQAAADACALAGAGADEVAAKEVAKSNNVSLTRYEKLGTDVRVIVRFHNVGATARATREVAVAHKFLAPALRAAVVRAESVSKKTVVIAKHDDSSITVTESVAYWLRTLSDSTGLCEVSPVVFQICTT